MKISIKETTEKIVEVELPVYRKSVCHFFKVYSDENCVTVTDTSFNPSIGVNTSSLAFNLIESENSTKEEFDQAFEKVSNKLKSLCQTN